MTRVNAYLEPDPHDPRDRQLAVRWALIAALRKTGAPTASVDLIQHMDIDIGAQAITMAASREPRYFVVSGKFSKIKRRKGFAPVVTIDLHPHLKDAPDSVRNHVHRSPQDRSPLTPSGVRGVEYREPAPVCEMPRGLT